MKYLTQYFNEFNDYSVISTQSLCFSKEFYEPEKKEVYS